MKKCLMIIVFIFFSANSIYAEDYSYIYRGVRPLGMGGAFVAVSNDENALFYNPAGLADIKETRSALIPLEIEMSQGAYDMYSDALDTDLDKEQETADFLKNYIGDYSHAAVSVFPYYARPRLAVGLIGTAKTNLQARDYQYPKLLVDSVADAGICLGYAYPFLENSLSVGVGGKYILRQSLNEEYTVLQITNHEFKDTLNDDIKDGKGFLLDVGLIYKIDSIAIDEFNIPIQIGLSANNFINNNFGDAQDLDEHIDFGISAHHKSILIALDYVDLFSQLGDDNDLSKRLHFGIEYSISQQLKLRAGLNQGYTTLGFGLDAGFAQFDMLTYAEEVATYAGQRGDRRYLLRLALSF